MKLFVDANILVAVLNKEYPLFTSAARVLSLADNRRVQLFTSPVCLAIAFYFAEKKSGRPMAKKKIALLVEKIGIAEHKKEDIITAANNHSISDFEDGMEYYAAVRTGCTHIITEDKNDFYFSDIEVLNCTELLGKIK